MTSISNKAIHDGIPKTDTKAMVYQLIAIEIPVKRPMTLTANKDIKPWKMLEMMFLNICLLLKTDIITARKPIDKMIKHKAFICLSHR